MRTQVIKVVFNNYDSECYLPLAENLDKENVETFDELKSKWEGAKWGYTEYPTVSLVDVVSQKEADEIENQLELFPEIEGSKPLVLDELKNLGKTLICEEFGVWLYEDLAHKEMWYRTPFQQNPDEYVFCCWFAADCYKGEVYSKDFSYRGCECCNRTICQQNPSNGYDWQFRQHPEGTDDGEQICSKCYEEYVIENGIDVTEILRTKSISGSWFTDEELEGAGYSRMEKFNGYLVGSGRTGFKKEEDFFIDIEKAIKDVPPAEYKTVIQYNDMAIGGLGGYISVWVKPRQYYRVFDCQRKCYFATGYNTTNKKDLIEEFQSYILGASEIDFEHEPGEPEYDEEVKNMLGTWELIEEHLQGVLLEKNAEPFEEQEY